MRKRILKALTLGIEDPCEMERFLYVWSVILGVAFAGYSVSYFLAGRSFKGYCIFAAVYLPVLLVALLSFISVKRKIKKKNIKRIN